MRKSAAVLFVAAVSLGSAALAADVDSEGMVVLEDGSRVAAEAAGEHGGRPPIPPGLQMNGLTTFTPGKVNVQDISVGRDRTGGTGAGTIITPGTGGTGDIPGQCPLCGVDGQGTDAQGVAQAKPDAQKGKSTERKPDIKKTGKKPDAGTAGSTRSRDGILANGTTAQGAAHD